VPVRDLLMIWKVSILRRCMVRCPLPKPFNVLSDQLCDPSVIIVQPSHDCESHVTSSQAVAFSALEVLMYNALYY